jgi:hypothetical protein
MFLFEGRELAIIMTGYPGGVYASSPAAFSALSHMEGEYVGPES